MALAATCALVRSPARAAVGACSVPASHASLASAIADPICASIDLAAGALAESVEIRRPVAISGKGSATTLLAGRILVSSTSPVELRGLRIENGCPAPSLQSTAGATVTGFDLRAVRNGSAGCPPLALFVDGFESGDARAWSSTTP